MQKGQRRTAGAVFVPVWGLLSCLVSVQAAAAPLPADELEQRCWLSHTRERTRVNVREPSAAEFSEHRPNFLFSREAEVDVRGPRSCTPRPKVDPARWAETCAAWCGARGSER